MRTILSVAKADFKERVRSFKYLCVLILIMILCFLFIAPKNAEYITNYMQVGKTIYRGIYNSEWIGAMIALVISVFLPLFGFYLVRGNIEHDRITGVNEILGTASVKKSAYLTGKFLSSLLVLITIVLSCVMSSILVQIVRGESYKINFISIIKPILVIVFPVICVTAAMAVLFECISFLRGSMGNIAYFLCYMVSYIFGMENLINNKEHLLNKDFFGIGILIKAMINGIKSIHPSITSNMIELFGDKNNAEINYIVWHGMSFDMQIIKIRLLYLAAAIVIIMISCLVFRGFYEKSHKKSIISMGKNKNKLINNKFVQKNKVNILGRLSDADFKYSVLLNISCEIKLILKNRSVLLILAVIFLFFLEVLLPVSKIEKYILPISSLIPLGFIAESSVKDRKNNMLQLIKSCENYKHYWFVSFISVVIVDLAVQSGILLKLLLEGQIAVLCSFIAGIAGVCGLAFLLAALLSNERLFEIIYILLWYFGVMNKIDYLDFTGFAAKGDMKMMILYVIAAAVFTMLTKIIREYKEV